MSTLNTSKIPLAVQAHSKLDLPVDHASTGNFMLLQPMYYRHTLKTENNHFNLTTKVVPAPIVVPTFGRIRQNLRCFFVPYRLVFPNWEEHINDVIASSFSASSQVSSVPCFNTEELCSLFFRSGDSATSFATIVTVSDPYDFIYNGRYWALTSLGRYCYKILYSLGYDILPPSKTFYFNALALLAYAKVYLDWYANSQYLNSVFVLELERLLKYNDPTNRLELNSGQIEHILLLIRPAVYDTNGYFESAWDFPNPVSPVSGQFSQFTFSDPTSSNGTYVTTNANGTPEMYQSRDVSTSVGTTYLHTALQKLTEYQRRHALSGARSIDRVLAAYGLQTQNLKLQRSIYVSCCSTDVDIQTIFATSSGSTTVDHQTYNSVVGDYSGAGRGNGNHQIQFQNDEEGLFIIISTIQPSGGYYQGYDRNNRHLSKTQFYNAEFDALGVQEIEKGEVYVSRDLDNFAQNATDYTTAFGWTGRYAEYKRSINRVSGDLAMKSAFVGGNCWHLMRQFDDVYFGNVNNIVHSEDFCRGTDADQYLRIFSYNHVEVDPFQIFLHVECASYSPCHSLNDDFEWSENGQEITLQSTGPKLN